MLGCGNSAGGGRHHRSIIANETNNARAAMFVKYRSAGIIGLLVGKTSHSLAGEPIYESFFLRPNAFAPPKRVPSVCGARRTRVARRSATASTPLGAVMSSNT